MTQMDPTMMEIEMSESQKSHCEEFFFLVGLY